MEVVAPGQPAAEAVDQEPACEERRDDSRTMIGLWPANHAGRRRAAALAKLPRVHRARSPVRAGREERRRNSPLGDRTVALNALSKEMFSPANTR